MDTSFGHPPTDAGGDHPPTVDDVADHRPRSEVVSARRDREIRRVRALRRRRARIRRNRLVAATLATVMAAGIWGIVGFLGAAGPGSRGNASAAWVVRAGPAMVVPGHLGHFSWPSVGEAAVGLQGSGVIATSPRQRVVPIASMTKMMTAIIVLEDHPLAPGEDGPMLTMTSADANHWVAESQNGDSTVPVHAGEHLSEYQMLEALMLPSGDNVADILATWDAGSMGAFVAKMNLRARSYGLARTSYADPSGVSPESESTPAEQIIVASHLMDNAVAREIVAQKSDPLPVAGTIYNVNPALGVDGILGVKSGFTQAAMGCLTVAAMRTVGHHRVMVITVSTGNLDGLYGAARVDEQLLGEARPDLVVVSPVPTGTLVASVDPTGATSALPLHPLGASPSFVTWRGAHLHSKLFVRRSASPGERGLIARLVVMSPTGTLGTVGLTGATGGTAQ